MGVQNYGTTSGHIILKQRQNATPHYQGPSSKKEEDQFKDLASVDERKTASQSRGAVNVDRKEPSG
jgi:hypothetical protein